ncbi:MAG: hypothetical protein ACD_12C00681G0001 [uncultured bacterium]|nr:MAG: hypothetical protein ACD_12C00681G0001 [uncultured bacterium]
MKNNYSFLFAILLVFFSAFLFSTAVFGGKTTAQSAKRPKPTPTVTPTKAPTSIPTPTPTTIVSSITDIEVIVSAPQQITSPNLINYSITVINHGPKVATAVQLCSNLDPSYFALNFIYEGNFRAMIGGIGRYGDCSVYGELDNLAVGGSETMSYSISEVSPITRTNTINVSAIETDNNLINNTQIITTLVN